jgi:uncharacterized protein YkwD
VADALVCLVNAQRQAQGIAALSRNRHLDGSASSHSADMVANHYFAHEVRGRPTLLERVLDSGYFTSAATGLYAEDLAVGPTVEATARNVVDAWMQSPDHRINLLDARLREVGVGAVMTGPDPVFYANYPSTVFTADFGQRTLLTKRTRRCRRSSSLEGSTSVTRPRRWCQKRRHPRR